MQREMANQQTNFLATHRARVLIDGREGLDDERKQFVWYLFDQRAQNGQADGSRVNVVELIHSVANLHFDFILSRRACERTVLHANATQRIAELQRFR